MSQTIEAFIEKWAASGAAERANKDMFLAELCDALDVPRPDPTTGDPLKDTYVFEKDAAFQREGGEQQKIHEQGLVSVLKKIHDDLDAAVFDAYGWPHDLTDEQILERLVALNAERAAEERAGLVRWLRPDFQNPEKARPMAQVSLGTAGDDEEEPAAPPPAATALAWPKKLPDQIASIRELITKTPDEWSADQVAAAFKGARKPDVEELLDTLSALGLLVSYELEEGRRWRAARFVERPSSNRPPSVDSQRSPS